MAEQNNSATGLGVPLDRDVFLPTVLGNRACPFGDKVLNRPSLRMMASNVFGAVAAENLGYAKVELQPDYCNRGQGLPDGSVSATPPRARSARGSAIFQKPRPHT